MPRSNRVKITPWASAFWDFCSTPIHTPPAMLSIADKYPLIFFSFELLVWDLITIDSITILLQIDMLHHNRVYQQPHRIWIDDHTISPSFWKILMWIAVRDSSQQKKKRKIGDSVKRWNDHTHFPFLVWEKQSFHIWKNERVLKRSLIALHFPKKTIKCCAEGREFRWDDLVISIFLMLR